MTVAAKKANAATRMYSGSRESAERNMDSPRIRQMTGSAIPANTRKTSISNVHRIARV